MCIVAVWCIVHVCGVNSFSTHHFVEADEIGFVIIIIIIFTCAFFSYFSHTLDIRMRTVSILCFFMRTPFPYILCGQCTHTHTSASSLRWLLMTHENLRNYMCGENRSAFFFPSRQRNDLFWFFVACRHWSLTCEKVYTFYIYRTAARSMDANENVYNVVGASG